MRFRYAWVVFSITLLALVVAAGVRATPGLIIVPLEREFGWSRALISVAISISLLLYGLVGPFAASLFNRFGIRQVMIGAMGGMAITMALSLHQKAPWQFVTLWGVLLGTGSGLVANVLGITVVTRWFRRQRGFLCGILSASTAAGQVLFLPPLAAVVEADGWRCAVYLEALALGSLVPLVVFFMRDAPLTTRPGPVGAVGRVSPLRELAQANPFAETLRALRLGSGSKAFWVLCTSFFICGATSAGLVGTHFIPACSDHGISSTTSAELLAMMGIFNVLGTVGAGWLSDRLDCRWLLCGFYALRGVSLYLLPAALVTGGGSLVLFSVLCGLDWTATVPPTIKLAAAHFGQERVNVMFGWMMAVHQVGAALAAYIAAAHRSDVGDYNRVFFVCAAMCAIGALIVLGMARFSVVSRSYSVGSNTTA